MDHADFEAAVAELVEPEVEAWARFEQHVEAAFNADQTVEQAADEVTAQFEENCGE